MTIPAPDFDTWLKQGYDAGYVGPAVCETHDGLPTSATEDTDAETDGEYPCIHILRLYESAEQKTAVEDNHSPSVWRASNAGL